MSEHTEHANWHVQATVAKWHRSEDHAAGLDPDEIVEVPPRREAQDPSAATPTLIV